MDAYTPTQNTIISARQWATGCWFPEVWKFLPLFSLAVKQHTYFFLLPTPSILPPPEHCHLIPPFWLIYSSFHLLWTLRTVLSMLCSTLTWMLLLVIWCTLCCSLNIFSGKPLSATNNRCIHQKLAKVDCTISGLGILSTYTLCISSGLVSAKLPVWRRIYWTPVVCSFLSQ